MATENPVSPELATGTLMFRPNILIYWWRPESGVLLVASGIRV